MTVFNGISTVMGKLRSTSLQTSPGEPAQAEITGATQMLLKVSQTGGTQTTPPPLPRGSTSMGETQTTTT